MNNKTKYIIISFCIIAFVLIIILANNQGETLVCKSISEDESLVYTYTIKYSNNGIAKKVYAKSDMDVSKIEDYTLEDAIEDLKDYVSELKKEFPDINFSYTVNENDQMIVLKYTVKESSKDLSNDFENIFENNKEEFLELVNLDPNLTCE